MMRASAVTGREGAWGALVSPPGRATGTRGRGRRDPFPVSVAAAFPPINAGACSVATAHTCGRPGTVDISPVDRAVLFPSRQPRHHALCDVTRSFEPHAAHVGRRAFGHALQTGTKILGDNSTFFSRAPSESGCAVSIRETVKELFKENRGHKNVSAMLGVCVARAYQFTKRNSTDEISFERVVELTSEKTTAAARLLAHRAGCILVPIARPDSNGPPLALIGEASRAHGEAIDSTASAAADGEVTPAEEAATLKKINVAYSALASLHGTIVAMARARQPKGSGHAVR